MHYNHNFIKEGLFSDLQSYKWLRCGFCIEWRTIKIWIWTNKLKKVFGHFCVEIIISVKIRVVFDKIFYWFNARLITLITVDIFYTLNQYWYTVFIFPLFVWKLFFFQMYSSLKSHSVLTECSFWTGITLCG